MVTRNALLYLARQEGLKDFATRFRPFKKMTTRFVAGEDINEAIALLAELELQDVEDLGVDYFEAELAELLPLA